MSSYLTNHGDSGATRHESELTAVPKEGIAEDSPNQAWGMQKTSGAVPILKIRNLIFLSPLLSPLLLRQHLTIMNP